eukprot:Nk52_evm17s490 gene=Nk52_evmTU17s490
MSIFEYNGGCLIAMAGKDCVAIACDLRLGIQAQTVATNFEKVFPMNQKTYVGLCGLATDVLTVSQKLKFRTTLYKLREERDISPKTLTALISNMLYEKRFGPFFVNPIVAGLDPKTGKPYLSCHDSIGCASEKDDFVVGGTCSEQLYGMCESLWEPDLSPDDLFETISQALINAFDRDAISGWGALVYIIEKDKVTTKRLKCRMD